MTRAERRDRCCECFENTMGMCQQAVMRDLPYLACDEIDECPVEVKDNDPS